MAQVEHHPWDMDEVRKGWQLSPDELERITGFRRDTRDYAFAIMDLASRLRGELRDEGRPAVVKMVRGHLRVLTDEEAVTATASASAKGVRLIYTSDASMREIDVANLSESATARLDSNILLSGARCSALRGSRACVRRLIKAQEKPELPEPEKK